MKVTLFTLCWILCGLAWYFKHQASEKDLQYQQSQRQLVQAFNDLKKCK